MKKVWVMLCLMLFLLTPGFVNAQETTDRASLAVLNFKNNSPNAKWDYMEKAVSEILSTSLSREKKLRIIERSQLDKALQELKLNQSGIVDSGTAQRVGKVLGVNIVVIGSITQLGEVINVSARLINVETGEAITGETIRCTNESELSNVLDDLSEKIVYALLHPGEKAPKTVTDREPSVTKKETASTQPAIVKKNIVTLGTGNGGYTRWLADNAAFDIRGRSAESNIDEKNSQGTATVAKWNIKVTEIVCAYHRFPAKKSLKGFYWGPLTGFVTINATRTVPTIQWIPGIGFTTVNLTEKGDGALFVIGAEIGYRWIWNWFALNFNWGYHYMAGTAIKIGIVDIPYSGFAPIGPELNIGIAF